MLRLSNFWLADGTFKTAPSLFTHVHVVHALRGRPQHMRDGNLLPSLWEQICTLCPLAQPREMLLDFEKAKINSFEEVWPDALVRCCFFHLTQNIWRKVQAAGTQANYNHDEELVMRIRQLPVLAFASPSDVQRLFEAVVQELPMPQATELDLYFERTYIGSTLPGAIVPYLPMELPHRHTLWTTSHGQRRGSMAPQP